MSQRTKDYTNPRLILRELHNILCNGKEWSESDKRRLSRWVNSSTINKNSDELFYRLRDEIIVGFSCLFPIKTKDGINFISNSRTHLYVGQFFSTQIIQPFTNTLLPYLVKWIRELEKVDSKDKQKEVALEMVTGFLETIVHHKKEIYSRTMDNSYWLPDELLIDMMIGKYWFLPKIQDGNSIQSRSILPIKQVLKSIVDLKNSNSHNELSKKAVTHLPSLENSKYDSRQSAYETLKKSLDRLKKGKGINLVQLEKLRKIPFSLLILGENWTNKDEKEKAKVIQGIASYFQLSGLSPKDDKEFDKRWRRLKDDQVEVIKESLDGIFETIIILAYLLSKVIQDLQKHNPNVGERLARLNK
ncbi:MAG: hypothetical protein ABJK11_14800 [Balneola sp.]